jgi:hypothetical protein
MDSVSNTIVCALVALSFGVDAANVLRGLFVIAVRLMSPEYPAFIFAAMLLGSHGYGAACLGLLSLLTLVEFGLVEPVILSRGLV